MKRLLEKIRQMLNKRRTRRILTRVVSIVGALVVFVTTYALVLPAITMEKQAACGIEEHQHDGSCFEEQLICGEEESETHQHTAQCYERVMVCGKPSHVHSTECYQALEESAETESGITESGMGDVTEADPAAATDSTATETGTADAAADGIDDTGTMEASDTNAGAENGSDTADAEDIDSARGGSETIEESGKTESGVEEDTGFDPVAVPDSSAEKTGTEDAAADETADTDTTNTSDANADSKDETGKADAKDTDSVRDGSTANKGADSAEKQKDDSLDSQAGAEAGKTSGAVTENSETAADAAEDQNETYAGLEGILDLAEVLTNRTDFYYYPAQYDENGKADTESISSGSVTDWEKVKDNTEIAPEDFVRVYLAYTIPAGTLNKNHYTARYRLPGALSLTEDQIEAINKADNGVTRQMEATRDDTDASTDAGLKDFPTDAETWRGAEAVEGTRTPDQKLNEGDTEYISATVKVENIYKDGEYQGQDLILTFAPYTVSKNQTTLAADGKTLAEGEKVKGFFALDLNPAQISCDETGSSEIRFAEESDTDDTASGLFAHEEILRTLHLKDRTGDAAEGTDADLAEKKETGTEGKDAGTTTENQTEATADSKAETADAKNTDGSDADAADQADASKDDEDKFLTGSVIAASGETYEVKVTYDDDAQIPDGSELRVKELLEEDDGYDDYCQQAVEKVEESSEAPAGSVNGNDTSAAGDNASAAGNDTSEAGNSESAGDNNTSATDGAQGQNPVKKSTGYVRVFDIEIWNNDQKIEPSAEVLVEIRLLDAPENKETRLDVVHFAEDGPEVLAADQNTQDTADTSLEFTTDAFSVYTIVGTELVTEVTLPGSDDIYEVIVTAPVEANIPRDAYLEVASIKEGTSEYQSAWNAAIGEDAATVPEIGMAALDITIKDAEGNTVEPEAPVQVSFVMNQIPDGVKEDDLANTASVLHLKEEGDSISVETVADTNWETSGIEVSDGAMEANFGVDSFSTFVITWTSSSSEASESNSTTTLNLQTEGGLTVQVNVHYVDQDGTRINRPTGVSATETGDAEYTISTENLARAINGAELQGAYFGSRDGDEVTKISVTGETGGTTTGLVKKGTAGNDGKPQNWTPNTYTTYYDADGEQIWYRKPKKDYRFFTTSSGEDKNNRYSGDVYARETTTAYNYSLTAIYNAADAALLRAAGDTTVGGTPIEYTGTSATWENAAEIYIVYGKAGDTVTLHFVDDQGNPLSGIVYDNTTLSDTVTYSMMDLFPNSGDTIDVSTAFTKEGYTYSNTYINYFTGTDSTPTGTPISNTLRRNGSTLQYMAHFGKNDYKDISDGTNIYLVFSPVNGSGSGGSGGQNPDTPDLGEIGNKKEISPNGDGTYQVGLSVSGTAQNKTDETKINVLFVMDCSNSMNTTTTGNNTRLTDTKKAVNNMADELLKNNTAAHPDAIELALVTFNRTAETKAMGEATWTKDYDTFSGVVNGMSTEQGTNWEAALRQANSVTGDGDPIVVIFFTDGQPTNYVGYSKNQLYTNDDDHTNYNEYYETDYWTARDEARRSVINGKTFYSIFAYGSTEDTNNDFLGKLTDYAYNSSSAKDSYRYNASNTTAVESALKAILKEINMNFAYTNVEIGDGITGLSTVTFESVDPESFNYTITYKDYTTYTEYTTKTANITVDKAANTITIPEGITYKVPDPDDPTKTNLLTKTTVATTLKGATYSNKQVTWDLEKSDGSIYMLLGDWTYAVDFKVWPSQRSYDLIAALNNKVIDWGENFTYTDGDGVTQTITFAEYESQINQGTPYSLKTNTSASVKYQQVTETIDDQGHSSYSYGEEKTVPITTSYNMRLDSTDMPVIKKFDDDINTHNPYTQVRFYLTVDGKYYQTDGTISDTLVTPESVAADGVHTWCMDLNSSNNWSKDVFISPGVITDHTEEGTRVVKVLETGHKYSLVEKNITGDEYEYEFTPQTLRPMVVNGTLKYLVKADKYNPAPTSGTTYTIDGDVYFEAPANAQALIGTNRKTGEIDITKVINDPNNLIPDGAEESETFTYAVTLNIPAGKDARGIMGYEYVARPNDTLEPGRRMLIYGYQREVDDEGNLISTPFTPDSTRFVGLVYGRYNSQVYRTFEGLDSNTDRTVTVYLTLKQNEVIRFTNLPTGTTYSITEVAANVGKADDGSNYPAPITSFTVPAGGTPAEQGYTVSSKSSAGGTGNDTITGEITKLDTRIYHQFTNTVTSYENRVYAELKVKKVVEDYDWLGEYYRFTLAAGEAAYSDGTTGTSPMPSANQVGAYQVSIYNDTPDHTLSFGSIRYTKAGTYQYTLTEGTYFNYVDYADPVTITVTVEEQNGELVVTNIEDDAGTTVFNAATSTAQANGLTTQTNKLKTIDVSATKEWLKADGTTVLTELPEGTTVTFTLCQGEDHERTGQTIVLDGVVDTTGESAAWVATWTGLPQYAVTTVTGDDGTQTRVATEIVYTIAEDIVPAGFEKITVDPVANGGKIQNKQLARDVNIQKRRQDGSTPLNGAIFELYTKAGYESTPKAVPIMTNLTSEKVGEVDGVIKLGELTYGEYYLVETTAPAGYNKLTEAVKLTVNANGISILQGVTLRTDDDLEDTDYKAFITNDEGIELPHTGGTGTLPYTLGGLMLVIASALMYGFRLRRRERRFN